MIFISKDYADDVASLGIEWLSKMPKELELSGSKESYYNGERQLKLFLRKK